MSRCCSESHCELMKVVKFLIIIIPFPVVISTFSRSSKPTEACSCKTRENRKKAYVTREPSRSPSWER